MLCLANIKLNKHYLTLRTTSKQLNWLGLMFGCLGFWLLASVSMTNPVLAAEVIYFSYGALERSISVAALEAYTKQGKLDADLAAYADYIGSQQLAQLRSALVTPIDVSPVAVSQFLYTPQGEILLRRLGQVIQTEARQPGFYALRAALILAATDPEGLTLLNVLQRFPTRSMRVDLGRSLRIAQELETLVNQTSRAATLVSQESIVTATRSPIADFSKLLDIRRRGEYSWNKRTLKLQDRLRDRTFPADVYLPNTKSAVPVIVISHGLGSDRTDFGYLARQLASYGFAVAVPEHPGSNSEQLRSLLNGRANEVAAPNEFINRPLDVKYLLNQLARLDLSDSSFQLNLQQVGVIGQSFGGYTALALAGAPLNFERLQQDCKNLNNSWDVSLLLQCRVLQLPRTQYNLSDKRVKAVIAINPITSSVFGEVGMRRIQIPVMFVSSSADTVAPALLEQMLPFTWLTSPEKYFALLEGGTHFSTIDESEPGTEAIQLPAQVIGPNPAIARRYMNALSVTFFQTYIARNKQYRPYLSAAYAQAISQSPLGLSLLQSLPPTLLTQSRDKRLYKIKSQKSYDY